MSYFIVKHNGISRKDRRRMEAELKQLKRSGTNRQNDLHRMEYIEAQLKISDNRPVEQTLDGLKAW